MSELPTGTLTFLMTDVEGSTRAWEAHPELMGAAISRHDALIEWAVHGHGGSLIRSKGEGDSTFSVFADARSAIEAAVAAQLALRAEPWPTGIDIRVRAALYTGEAELRDGDYFGIAPNRCARLRAVAHGGQTLCSESTSALVSGRWPGDVSLLNLGLHRLRDLSRAERVFQVCHADLPGGFPPLLSLGVRHNLPQQRSSFVGREDDFIAVKKHLEAERLVTLTGVGGCGKTRLALEVAGSQLDRFPDGVFFVDLAPVSGGHLVAGTVASAVGFSWFAIGTGSGRPGRELLDFLAAKDVLLVIDNCEHLVDASAHLVDEILERCPRVSVLATSRAALQLQGEQLYPVPPLSVPADDDVATSAAAELFRDRAVLVRPDFVLSETNAADVGEICRRLDGIPLAIELAAAQLSHLSPRQVIERLGDRLRLSSQARARSQRQQTLQATLDWSYGLLTEDESAALRCFAAFPGGFSFAAAEAVCGDREVLTLLGALVGKSLLVTDAAGDDLRYRLLETVRLYAEEKLIEAGEEAFVRDLHRDHFVMWAESLPQQETFLDSRGVVRAERHNLQAALNWSERQGRADLVGRLASTMTGVWAGDIRDGRRWLSIGVEAADELDPEHRVRVLSAAALVDVLAIQAGPQAELAHRAVEAAGRRPGMWSALAHALVCLSAGIRFFFTKDPVFAKEAEESGATAVSLAPDDFSRRVAWFWVGQSRVLLGDLDGASQGLARGVEPEGPSSDLAVLSVAMLAGVLHITGRHDDAATAAERALIGARSYAGGLWAWALYCSLPYALELGRQGREAEARAVMRDLLVEGGTPRTPGVMTSALIVLGALAVQRGDEEAAHILLDFAAGALIRDGVRTPVDIALLMHYQKKLRGAADAAARARYQEIADRMSVDEAVAYGVDGLVPAGADR